MENTSYYQSIDSYPPIINDISKQLSKAGLSVLQVGVYDVEKIGTIYDIYIDSILDEEFFNKLYTNISSKYGYFIIQTRSTTPVLRLIPIKRSNRKNRFVKLLLLITTFITVTLTGYGLTDSFNQLFRVMTSFEVIIWSIAYTVLFLTALSLHEFGHIISSRKSGIVIDGPYFIPAPPIQLGFIGTLGAVINMKTLPPDRRSLARLGLSGPLTGFIAGIVISIVGLYLSPIIPISYAEELIKSGQASEVGFSPTILVLLFNLKHVPEGYTLFLHPILLAGMIIFLVTFLNLLPIAQLDGGHVVRSYMSSHIYEKIGLTVPVLFLTIGLTIIALTRLSIGWFFTSLSLVTLILKAVLGRRPHPGPANQFSQIKDYRYLIIYIALVILTAPIPSP